MAVFGFGRRNAVGRQYNGGNVSVMLPRYTTPPERNTRDWLEMFGRNPRLAVVDRIASDLSTCAGKLYRKDENGEEVEITDHPFLNFMAHPNPLYEMTSGACWRLQQIYLELKGEGYFVYEFDALGRPVELWPLPTHWVQQTPYVGYPYYEIRTTGGLIRQIPVDDIFCMKELNPLDPYKRGLGAAAVSYTHLTKLAENMRDMDMTEGRRFLRDAVLEHFGVPREIMGITESSNRATSEAAQYIYAQNVIMPRLNRREEAINTQILPFYGNDLVWHFDDVVPRSQEFDKAKGIDGWNAGLLTKDEARELLGMEPCKTGGDCFKITISDMFIGSNDDPAEVTTDLMQESTDEVEVTDDEDTGGMLSMSDRREHEEKSRVQNIGNLLAAAQKAQRAKFEVATMKFFRQQQKRLSGSLSGTEKADWSVWDVLMPYITENHVEDSAAWSALGEQEQKNLVEQFIGGLVNWPSEETAMEEIFKPLWKQTYDEGTRIAKQAYNIRGVDRPELLSQAKLHGGKRVRRVTQTTKENISRIVANGIEAGIGREKMADEILQEYEIQTRSRARLIADQETVMTLETGHYDMMQKSGATTKTWHHRPQKNPRDGSNGGPNHVKMDGETVPIDARFSNGLRYPCDPEGPARETIKCRCYVTYNR